MNLIILISFFFVAISKGQLDLKTECSCDSLHKPISKLMFNNASKVNARDLQFTAFTFLHQNLIESNIFFCSAILLNSEWGISPFSCTKELERNKINGIARIGVGTDIDFDTFCHHTNLFRDIDNFVFHNDTSTNSSDNIYSISLIHAKTPFELGSEFNIYAPCLIQSVNSQLDKFEIIVSGYEFMITDFNYNPRFGKFDLYSVKMKLNNSICENLIPSDIQKKSFCLQDNTQLVCPNQIGGPALINVQISTYPKIYKLVLIGIVNYGFLNVEDKLNCSNKVFVTSLSKYFDWIREYINNEFCHSDLNLNSLQLNIILDKNIQENLLWGVIIILSITFLVLTCLKIFKSTAKSKDLSKSENKNIISQPVFAEKSKISESKKSSVKSIKLKSKTPSSEPFKLERKKSLNKLLKSALKFSKKSVKESISNSEKTKKIKKSASQNLSNLGSKVSAISNISKINSDLSSISSSSYAPNLVKTPIVPQIGKTPFIKSSISVYQHRRHLDKPY